MNDPLIEYMKIHLISLEQDLEDALYIYRTNRDNHNISDIDYLNGQIAAINHILDTAQELDEQSLYVVG